MRISRLHIENFRSIQGPLDLDVPQIAAIVGANNTGKSNLLAALEKVFNSRWLTVNVFDDAFRRTDNVIECVDPSGQSVSRSRKQQFDILMQSMMDLLHTDEFSRLEKSIKDNALSQLGFDPVQHADKLDFYFAPFTSLDFYRAIKLFIREGEFTIDATQLGGGVQNSLVIAILRAFEERRKHGAIFLIEEPEMYMHPQMQRSLYRTLRDIGTTNQVIYTTHSPHFVTIPEYNEVVLVTKDNDGTKTRTSSLPITAQRKEKLRKELDPERNELFFAKKLVLVEGDTEKLAFPEYAMKLKIDLDREGVTVVEVGGKRNLPEFVNIAKSFGIKTAVCYDEDSSDFNKDDKNAGKEAAFNADLENLKDGATTIWKFSKRFEDELRAALGEKKYQELCQRYPSQSKPIRQRLIANDLESGVPDFVKNILEWSVAN